MPTTEVDSIEYYYRENGESGPLVILGHSDASSSAQWRALLQELGGEFRLKAFDTSGQGRSQSWPNTVPYSVTAESAIVDALSAAETERFHLVGHSAGAMFLLGAALRLRERVASLTLIEPVMFALLKESAQSEALAEAELLRTTFQRQVRAGCPAEAMAGFVDYWTVPGHWDAMPEDRRAPIIATAPKIFIQWDAALNDEHTLRDYARITCPTLLMRGAETTLAARCVTDVLNGALPDCELLEIDGVGHLLPITHPEIVNPYIAAHLRHHAGP